MATLKTIGQVLLPWIFGSNEHLYRNVRLSIYTGAGGFTKMGLLECTSKKWFVFDQVNIEWHDFTIFLVYAFVRQFLSESTN